MNHLDEAGNPHMVDISSKEITHRSATAHGVVTMAPETMQAIAGQAIKKGNVLLIAQLAGIQATKRTPDLIPLCHPIMLTGVDVQVKPKSATEIEVTVTCRCDGKTGVEMEALTGVTAACLTIYDMCKSIDRSMTISSIQLIAKAGGKSGDYHRATS